MNHLSDLILPLNKEEVRSYKLFAQRINFENSDKKIIDLFEQIRQQKFEENDERLVKKIFGKTNHNAYYRLKHRLTEDLERSLLTHHFALDKKVEGYNLLILSKIFYYKSAYKQALNYLLKAEKQAEAANNFELLNLIYDEILSIGKQYSEFDPQQIIEKHKKNFEKYQFIQQMNALIASLNYQLRQTNFSGKNKNVLPLLNKALQRLNIAKKQINLPVVQLQIHNCVKNALLFKKNFEALEFFLTEDFKKFEKQKLYDKQNHHEKLVHLIWIINSAYKNKNLSTVAKYLKLLEKTMNEFNKLNYEKYLWAYYQSLTLFFAYSNQLQNSIDALETYKQKAFNKDVLSFNVNVYLNLASLYFYKNELTNANKNIAQLLTKNVFQHLSNELKLTVSMVDLMLSFANNDFEYTERKTLDIKRNFNKMLADKQFEKEKTFLKLMNKMTANINWRKNKLINEQIELFCKQYPKFEPGSNEALNYVIFLRSQLSGVSYYQILLAEMAAK